MSKPSHIETTPVDCGYSWIVLLATTGIYLIIGSAMRSYVILYAEFLLYFGTGSGNTAWIGSVYGFLLLGIGLVSNRLSEKYSFRAVIFCGAIMHAVGVFLSAYVQRMELMYLTYGIIGGIGAGLIFAPTNTILNFYFEKKRALANGVMVSGAGVGGILFPYMYRYLIDKYRLQGALLILSAILANICVGAALLRQPSQLMRKLMLKENSSVEAEIANQEVKTENHKDKHDNMLVNKENAQETSTTKHNVVKETVTMPKKTYLQQVFSTSCRNFSLFRNPTFSMLVLVFVATTLAYHSNYSVMVQKILELGYSNDEVSIALSISASAEIFSKLFFGWLMDLNLFHIKYLLIFTLLGGGISAAVIPFLTNFVAYGVYAGILGAIPGVYMSFIAVALLQCIKLTDLTHGFGLTTMCMSFGVIISQPIAGWIEDATGSWDYSLWYLACLYLFSTAILFGEPLFNRYWCFRIKHTNDAKEEAQPELASETLDFNETHTLERNDNLELVSQFEKDNNTYL